MWAERVARWQASGLTATEFARRHRLAEASLKWWRWKLGSTGRAPAKKSAPLPPLTFVEMTGAMRRESLARVLASGVEVRVPADFDVAALGRLLDVLERR